MTIQQNQVVKIQLGGQVLCGLVKTPQAAYPAVYVPAAHKVLYFALESVRQAVKSGQVLIAD